MKQRNEEAGKVGVCILAAGIAKRLEPISGIIAKPAFPLGGRVPIVELWVRKFVAGGFTNITMNLHRVPESIRSYFGNGRMFMSDISYVYEELPTGTLGGAINMVKKFHAQNFFPERVFIPSGDIVTTIGTEHLNKILEQHRKSGAAVTMMLAPIPWDRRKDFGTAILDGFPAGDEVAADTYARIVDFAEKDPDSPSNLNNASLYLVETDFLLGLEPYLTEASLDADSPCYDFGKHVFMGMKGKVPHLSFLEKSKDAIYGYVIDAPWFDIGNKRDYLSVNIAVLQGEVPIDLPYFKYPWGWMGHNVEIDYNRVTIKPPVIIGNNCTIFPDTEIGPNVILGDGWVVHRKAKIRNSVLWPHYDYNETKDGSTTKISRIREIREGVEIDSSIIVGGIITMDIREKTFDILPDGTPDIRGIDSVSEGPRA